jgi:2-methylisocitrate lyase-like PEP mutase family enzyme
MPIDWSCAMPASPRDLSADAAALRRLHHLGTPLLLANVWDPTSAQAVEAAGLPAIATASAAVAPVNGFEDHGHLPASLAFAAVARIAAAVTRPVTADLEDGYGLTPRELVERMLAAGACGLNIEDTDHRTSDLLNARAQAWRIAGIRRAGEELGVRVVINARIDVYLRQGAHAEGIERARLYREAGADCVYPIFLADPAMIREHVAMGPVNLLGRPSGLSLKDMAELGVARISLGPQLHRMLLARLRTAAEALARLDDAALWG